MNFNEQNAVIGSFWEASEEIAVYATPHKPKKKPILKLPIGTKFKVSSEAKQFGPKKAKYLHVVIGLILEDVAIYFKDAKNAKFHSAPKQFVYLLKNKDTNEYVSVLNGTTNDFNMVLKFNSLDEAKELIRLKPKIEEPLVVVEVDQDELNLAISDSTNKLREKIKLDAKEYHFEVNKYTNFLVKFGHAATKVYEKILKIGKTYEYVILVENGTKDDQDMVVDILNQWHIPEEERILESLETDGFTHFMLPVTSEEEAALFLLTYGGSSRPKAVNICSLEEFYDIEIADGGTKLANYA